MLKLMMNKDLEFIQSNLSVSDFEVFKKKHAHFEKKVLNDLKKFYE